MGYKMHNEYRKSKFSHCVEAIFGLGLESLLEIILLLSKTLNFAL